MARKTVGLGVVLASLGWANLTPDEVAARGVCQPDPCTPPPCAADGVCRPKRATWGYYQQTWNRWPGDYDEAAGPQQSQPLPDGQMGPDPIPDIEPGEEDLSAPPASDAELENEEEGETNGNGGGEGAREIELPPLPPLRPLLPPAGIGGPPAGGAGDGGANGAENPPPAMPQFGPPAGAGPGPGAGFSLKIRGPVLLPPSSDTDAPPPLPATFTRSQDASSRVVQRTGYQAPAPHRLPAIR